jgi:uncharacterized protein
MRPTNWSSLVATEFIAINTGPMILLEKADALDVAARLPYRFVCPLAVRAELDAGVAKGYPVVNPPWLSVLPLKTALSPLARATLDEGEAEVIQLALERGYRHVCLDDLRGRRIAAAAGLKVTGVLGRCGVGRDLRGRRGVVLCGRGRRALPRALPTSGSLRVRPSLVKSTRIISWQIAIQDAGGTRGTLVRVSALGMRTVVAQGRNGRPRRPAPLAAAVLCGDRSGGVCHAGSETLWRPDGARD